MGSTFTRPNNGTMVDNLVKTQDICSANVEGAFRAVDRAMYYEIQDYETVDPYKEAPWRRGNLHLSAPCIYAKTVEALDLKPGLSFLNLGSGTGYLNTIVGLLIGPNGTNHGLELHLEVVDYAYKRLQEFKLQTFAIDKFEFSEPTFVHGNCVNLNPNSKYDRVYLGAACLPEFESFMKILVKPNGGILVMPYRGCLMRYVRTSETNWECEELLNVDFTLMIARQIDDDDSDTIINMPIAKVKSLKELCRTFIRRQLRDKVNTINPELLHSDNVGPRKVMKERLRARQEDELIARLDYENANSAYERYLSALQRKKHSGCKCKRDCIKLDEHSSSDQKPSSSRTTAEPTPSVSGIMTRSASRRLNTTNSPLPQSSSTSSQLPSLPTSMSVTDTISYNTSDFGEQSSPTNIGLDNNNLDTSDRNDNERSLDDTLGSSDSDDDDDDDEFGSNSTSRVNYDETLNCARTRPFVYSFRNSSPSSWTSHLNHCIRYTSYELIRRRDFIQRRVTRIIDQPEPKSPSSSSRSSSSSMPDLSDTELEAFDREMVEQASDLIIQSQPRSASVQHNFGPNFESHSANIFARDNSPSPSERRLSPQPPLPQHELSQTRLDCKRKRQSSSSESSEASNPSSPARQSQASCRNDGFHECPCTQSKLIGTDRLGESTEINAGSSKQSSSSGQINLAASTLEASTSRTSPPSPSHRYRHHHRHRHRHRHHHRHHHHHQKTSRQPIPISSSSRQSHNRDSSRSRFSGPSSSTFSSQVLYDHSAVLVHRFIPVPTGRSGSETYQNPTFSSFWEPLPCCERRRIDSGLFLRSCGYRKLKSYLAFQASQGKSKDEALALLEKARCEQEAWNAEQAERRQEELRSKMRRRREKNECERYYCHMRGYIRQLPLPRTLHSYLNLERKLRWT